MKILILGGCGFIGRYILKEVATNFVECHVTVADKVPPQIAWLNQNHFHMFQDSRVDFRSCNLINKVSVSSLFEDSTYDWVINCAGETKKGQVEAVYEEGIYKLSTNCASLAAKNGVQVYVEISSGKVLSDKLWLEEDLYEPSTAISKMKQKVEEDIKKIPNLNWVIIRPGLVYGCGDKYGIANKLILGAIYFHLSETMKLMWDENLWMNTVHVKDLARAVVFLCQNQKTGEIYNVVDDANSTQGSLSAIISEIFKIKTEYLSNILSTVAKNSLGSIVEEANEKHLTAWAMACSSESIENTPLSPYIDQDSLVKGHIHLSNKKLAAEGFSCLVSSPTKENLREIIEDFIEMKIFPARMLM